MKGLPAAILIAILFIACNPLERSDLSPEEAIPDDALRILKVNDPVAVIKELKKNTFTASAKRSKSGQELLDPLDMLEVLGTEDPGYLVVLPGEGDSLTYLYISKVPEGVQQTDSLADSARVLIDTVQPLVEHKRTPEGVFFTELGNLRFTSTDSTLIEKKRKEGIGSDSPGALLPLLSSFGKGKAVSLFIDSRRVDSLYPNDRNANGIKWSDLAGTVALDLNLNPNMRQWTGVGIPHDSIPSLVSLFDHTQPVVNTLASLAPEGADGLLEMSFTDQVVFSVNQQKRYPQARQSDPLFRTTEEVGMVFQDTDRAVIINTFGALSLSEYLQVRRTSSYDYQGKEVGILDPDTFLEEAFPSLIRGFRATHYCVFDNAFVFSESKAYIELIIRNINSGNTFDTSEIYRSARSEMAEASSLLLLADKSKLDAIAANIIPLPLLQHAEADQLPDHVFAFQVVADRSFCHLNSFLKRKSKSEKRKGVAPYFTVQLDAPMATDPQFVTDHRNNKKEIVVQDTENNLYLISTDGKVLWKKALEGRVQGKIEQIDLYKNGRLQLAFTTSNQFLVLDRNGEEVAPFTMKFSGAVLNPLAVFDYEGNRNYRFVVTQGRDVRMYNSRGKIVSGFKYTKAEEAVLDRPKHFRIGTRDYLVFRLEDGSLRILNRVGDTRVKVGEKIDFSDNDVYLYNDKFVVTDKTGTLFSVDTRGKITKTRFNLAADHGIDATTKTLSLMNDNELTIKGNKASLDLGVYTRPRIFYIYDKIYVSVTDVQSQKAYLFDSNAIPFPNFPVYASSAIDLSDMDNDRSIEIAAKFEENSLIVYTLN